jgi:hypothetical protein
LDALERRLLFRSSGSALLSKIPGVVVSTNLNHHEHLSSTPSARSALASLAVGAGEEVVVEQLFVLTQPLDRIIVLNGLDDLISIRVPFFGRDKTISAILRTVRIKRALLPSR